MRCFKAQAWCAQHYPSRATALGIDDEATLGSEAGQECACQDCHVKETRPTNGLWPKETVDYLRLRYDPYPDGDRILLALTRIVLTAGVHPST